MFFYKKPETQFFMEYLNNLESTTDKSACRRFCEYFVKYEDKRVNVTRFKKFLDEKILASQKALAGINQGKVTETDLKTMAFDIFIGKKKI